MTCGFSLGHSQRCGAHHKRQSRHEGGDQNERDERQQQVACDQPFEGRGILRKQDGPEHAVSFRQPDPRQQRQRKEMTGRMSNPDLLKGKHKADNRCGWHQPQRTAFCWVPGVQESGSLKVVNSGHSSIRVFRAALEGKARHSQDPAKSQQDGRRLRHRCDRGRGVSIRDLQIARGAARDARQP